MSENGTESARFRWLGTGATGFLLPCDEKLGMPRSGWSRPSRVRSPEEARETIGGSFTARHAEALGCFFRDGGRECSVVPVPKEPRFWLGENGGPGERTGAHALLDEEDISSIVIPPVTPRRLEDFLGFARCHQGRFLILEERSRKRSSPVVGGAMKCSRPLENLLLVESPLSGGSTAATIAGCLETRDVADWRSPVRAHRGRPAALTMERGMLDAISSWRLRAGLRRSLDHGSRWVVFEPNHPFVWRRLERETRAFLHDLTLGGVLPAWGGERFDVCCGPVPGEPGRVVLRVEAAMDWNVPRVRTSSGRSGR